MTEFRFSARSRANLIGVEPRLVAVVEAALARSAVDFAVIEGLRTYARQEELYAQGRTTPGKIVTWTMDSRHIPQADGYSHAVDLAAWVDGGIKWEPWSLYEEIARAMKEAAAALAVPLVWGGDWKRRDGAHFELVELD